MSKQGSPMERVVLLAGRFQPPHPGHAQAYRQLCAQFGDEHVYVGTSDKQDPPDRRAATPSTSPRSGF
ncbi:MAG: adenylyltransferase/cytidyltransferase family protein [Alphaproteobacteria bacterium]|nr:adenylyltransferase/cytidyltransferase family protein [Alphaproteobacteria bacterium]